MKFNNYDMVLLTDQKQRMYYLGFNSSAGYVMQFPDITVFVVDNRYYHAAKKQLKHMTNVEVICSGDYNLLVDYVKFRQIKVIGIDFSVTTVKLLDHFKFIMPEGTEFFDIGPELEAEASIKNFGEIKAIKKACSIAERAFKEIVPFLEVGVTERAIAAELEYMFKKFGASDKSFDTIVAFGENSAIPHHESGNTALKENVPVLMDFGCIYQGYCSDMTRTMFFGVPDMGFLRRYKAVYDAHMNVFNNVRAGMTGKEADALARSVLEERGFAQYFTHSLGHGVGIHVHEHPYLAPSRFNVLQNGMVFSNEPGIYFNGYYGIRIEDTCYLECGVAHTFMKDDKRLIVIQDGKAKKFNFLDIK